MKILHCTETSLGGCGSYLNEIVPLQIAELGAAQIRVIVPYEHRQQLASVDDGVIRTFRRPSRAAGLLGLCRTYTAEARRFRPDVVHAHSTFAGLVIRILGLFTWRRPVIIYCPHGWAFEMRVAPWQRTMFARCERMLAPFCDRIVAISQAERDQGRGVGIADHDLRVVHNGVARTPPETAYAEWPGAGRKILFVGRLDPQKGVDILIEAVDGLDSVSVHIVGDRVVGGAGAAAARSNIAFQGWMSQRDVFRQMNACDLVVVPSRWEGFGLVAVEAMRAGKPVIASAVGGLPEIVVHGVTGRLVPAEDAVALRQAIWADSDEALRQMGRAGRARFLQHFTSERLNDTLLELYRISMARPIYINGRFLTQSIGGVQRFCREVVTRLDRQLQAPGCLLGDRRWVLLAPPGTACDLGLQRIEFRTTGASRGHVWEQIWLSRAAADGTLVNLANSAPLAHPRSLTVIHDLAVYRIPENFSLAYRSFHKILGHLLAYRTRIGTVSEFSKSEFATVLHVDPGTVFLVPNACDHHEGLEPDIGILSRLGVAPGRYFLQVGTPTPNKNVRRAIAAYARLRSVETKFVLVGKADPAVFNLASTGTVPGVIPAGRLSDAEVAALYRNSTALVFPSLYEGFGIPPIEAMSHGCPVLAARIPPVEEVCGDAAIYFDPLSERSIEQAMRRLIDHPDEGAALRERGLARAALFSWDRTARQLLAAIAESDTPARKAA